MKPILKYIQISSVLLLTLTLLTGVFYPLLITGIAQLLFPFQSNGSLLMKNQQNIGSELIGQHFKEAKYIWGRPSSTTPYPYNASNSMGSNFGPMNLEWVNLVKLRVANLLNNQVGQEGPIPSELLYASGSGLDPHISPMAAYYQVLRISKNRLLSEVEIKNLINQLTEKRSLGLLGEPRVNVLKLNLALDELENQKNKGIGDKNGT